MYGIPGIYLFVWSTAICVSNFVWIHAVLSPGWAKNDFDIFEFPAAAAITAVNQAKGAGTTVPYYGILMYSVCRAPFWIQRPVDYNIGSSAHSEPRDLLPRHLLQMQVDNYLGQICL